MKRVEDSKWKTEGRRSKAKIFGLKKVALIFTSVLFMFSCQDVKKPEMPEDLISKDKMVNIMHDVYISNASRSVNSKLLRKTGVKLDSLIYTKYEIDSLQFVKSNAYYSSNLKEYEEIINKVKDRLTILKREKDSVYKIIKKKKDDSIIKLNLELPKVKKDTVKKMINPAVTF